MPDALDDPVTVADTAHKTIDLVIILDRSGSMNDPSGVSGVSTRLELAGVAIAALFESYQSVADLDFQIGAFADSAASSGWLGTPEAANAYLAGLTATGGTNYAAAIDAAMISSAREAARTVTARLRWVCKAAGFETLHLRNLRSPASVGGALEWAYR